MFSLYTRKQRVTVQKGQRLFDFLTVSRDRKPRPDEFRKGLGVLNSSLQSVLNPPSRYGMFTTFPCQETGTCDDFIKHETINSLSSNNNPTNIREAYNKMILKRK